LPLLRCFPYSLLLLANALSTAVWAEENWGLCQALSFTPIEAISSDVTDATEIESNFMSRQTDDVINFGGQVKLTRPALSLLADRLSLNNETEQIKAAGHVTFESPDYRLQTESMTMNRRDRSAYFSSSSFTLPKQHIRGSANEVIQLNSSRSRYKGIQYTTCDPGNSTWRMTADQLDINQESGRGTAKHATVYIQDVPVFYLPYLQFPIDDRRMSGVLTPAIGHSDTNGSFLSVPVYWNIAPNLDAIITPAWYGDRGVQLNTENRYLFKNHAGQIDLSHLDDDKENDSRWFQKWVHRANLGSNITADITWREVSDSTFFDDFESLGDSADDTAHLERHVTLNHSVDLWQSSLLFQAYQTPDPNFAVASAPYRRLPRLTVNSRFGTFDNGIQFNTSNEWVRFDHQSSSNVVGDRTHLLTYLSWEQTDSGYFFKPKLEYAFSDYQLDNNSLGANSIQRDIPILSLDTGLFFDREMSIGTDWTQTLEPRLYFLHTPYMDQSNIPVFDSAVLSDTYDNFFESNRFNGADRIGDANQVSFGIGTRILNNNSGVERLYSRIGQTFYADDRRVQISGNTPQTDSKSNIISETTIRPNQRLSIHTKLVYQPTSKKISQKILSIQHLRNGFATNLDYFFSDTVLEQAAVSMVYPINPRWMMVAKYSTSIFHDKPIDNLFGVNYESCCWGIKILARQISNDTFTITDSAVFFEFTLKGLGQSSRILDSQLANAIPGYKANF
jgi:LPS-assembly protein